MKHGYNILKSNLSIIDPFSGITDTLRNLKGENKKNLWDAVKEGHKAKEGDWSVGGYSPTKIAGTYIAGSAAGRILSGGGIYKDSDGNTDIIGIPFF